MKMSRALLALALALVACNRLKPAEERTVQRWLLCEECVEGEQDSVVALAIREGRVEKALIKALKDGPSKERLNNMRLQAVAMYKRIPPTPGGITQKDYVDHYLLNYRMAYASRSAIALRRVPTASAHAALIAAVRRDSIYREDVREVLGSSAGVIVSIEEGDSQHAPVDSFVQTDPAILVLDSTNGQGLGNIRVVFLVDSGGGAVGADSVRLTDPNGRAAAHWRLGPGSPDSLNYLRAIAAGHVVRFQAFGHPLAPRVVFLVQPSNSVAGHAIDPPVRIAVQDGWGTIQTTFNLNAEVTVVGTALHSAYTLVSGVAELQGFSVPNPGTGLRLRVEVLGTPPAFSAPFKVSP